MRPGLATDDVFVERFRAEARSAARLSHPNVVAVFDQGEDDGEVFLAMELVEGKTLRDVIHEEAPLTAREALAILEPILLALRAAHAAGMIHRDVKPENVIVRRDGEVKVADFGLARAITNQAATSQTGVLLGTVSYLSPEQVERGVADHPQRRVRRRPAPLRDAHRAQGRHGRHADPDRLQPRPRLDPHAVARSFRLFRPTSTRSSHARRPSSLRTASIFGRGFVAAAARRAARPVRRRARPARAAAGPDPATTSALPALSTTSRLPRPVAPGAAVGRCARAPAAPGPTMSGAQPLGRPARARRRRRGLEHTAAMPIDRRPVRGVADGGRSGVAVALLVAGVAFGGWWFTGGPGGSTVVPAVVGQQVSAGRGRAGAGLPDDRTPSSSSPRPRPRASSLRVEPGAGQRARQGVRRPRRRLQGQGAVCRPEARRAPSSTRRPPRSPRSPLTLRLATRRGLERDRSRGRRHLAGPGARARRCRRNAAVSVVVSKGREPIEVPTVTGAAVRRGIGRRSPRPGSPCARGEDVNSDTVPAGQVVSQTPDKGTLHRGDAVTLVVSKGPVMVPGAQRGRPAGRRGREGPHRPRLQGPEAVPLRRALREEGPRTGASPPARPVPKGSTITPDDRLTGP